MSPEPHRPRRPSLAVVLAGLAVVLAMTGTAVAAGQLVTIVDTTNGQSARVSGGGLKVNGSVTAREAVPADLVTAVGETFSGSPSSTCTKIYEPPSGKALVLTGTEVAAYSVGASGNIHRIFVNSTATPCGFGSGSSLFSLASLTSPGTVVRQYPAGVPVPNGSAVYTNQFVPSGGSRNSATVAIDGYLVPSATVPALGKGARIGDQEGSGATGTGPR